MEGQRMTAYSLDALDPGAAPDGSFGATAPGSWDRTSDRKGARRPDPATRVERPVSARSRDLRRSSGQWARGADSGHSTSNSVLPRSPAMKFCKTPHLQNAT